MKLYMIHEAALGKKPSQGEIEAVLRQPYEPYVSRNRYQKSGRADTSGVLLKAIHYHRKNFNGKRWPALEYALIQRAGTYFGVGGDFMRARTSLFDYLNNITEKWPAGDIMAEQIISSYLKGKTYDRYFTVTLGVETYARNRYGDKVREALNNRASAWQHRTSALPDCLGDMKNYDKKSDYYDSILNSTDAASVDSEVDWRDNESYPEDYYAM